MYDLLGEYGTLDEVGSSFCTSLVDIQDILECRDPLADQILGRGGEGGSTCVCVCVFGSINLYYVN